MYLLNLLLGHKIQNSGSIYVLFLKLSVFIQKLSTVIKWPNWIFWFTTVPRLKMKFQAIQCYYCACICLRHGNKKKNFIPNIPNYVHSVRICLFLKFHCSVSEQCWLYKQFQVHWNFRKRITYNSSLSTCVLLCQTDACQDM